MPRYLDHEGKTCSVPRDKQEAIKYGQARYLRPADDPTCPVIRPSGCVCICPVLYTDTDECVVCTALNLHNMAMTTPDKTPTTWDEAVEGGFDYILTSRPCKDGPHLRASWITKNSKACARCQMDKHFERGAKRAEKSPRQKAIANREKIYMPEKQCRRCGMFAYKNVENGACHGCMPAKVVPPKSPRQIAMAAGEQKYLPDEPCPKCGQAAPKRVDTGRCDGCNPPKRPQATISPNTRLVMDGTPSDHILDKTAATAMDLTAYRDGKYCPEGHQGWKYIANGKCVTCGGET